MESLTSLAEGKPKFSCSLTDGADAITAVLATQVPRAPRRYVLPAKHTPSVHCLLARPAVCRWAPLPSRYIRAAH